MSSEQQKRPQEWKPACELDILREVVLVQFFRDRGTVGFFRPRNELDADPWEVDPVLWDGKDETPYIGDSAQDPSAQILILQLLECLTGQPFVPQTNGKTQDGSVRFVRAGSAHAKATLTQ